MTTASKECARELMRQLEGIDAQMQQNASVLKQNNIGMEDALVDAEGYPRSDVDVYAVRNARKNIICLRNDRKAKMDEIETALEELHSQAAASAEEPTGQGQSAKPQQVHRTSNDPFVQVDKVMADSPAHKAGLCNGDLIVQFGPLHADVFEKLDQVKQVVADCVNAPIRITALRNWRVQKVELVPHTWNGAGLVGCSFVVVERGAKNA